MAGAKKSRDRDGMLGDVPSPKAPAPGRDGGTHRVTEWGAWWQVTAVGTVVAFF
jgi:hypothetical protein